jgi:hypothetical protein
MSDSGSKSYFSNSAALTAAFLIASPLLAGSSCWSPAPTADATPPTISILKWEQAGGAQGAQTQVPAGGSFTVPWGWLGGPTKADIRVYGSDAEGLRQLQVSGTVQGTCGTYPDSSGQTHTAFGSASLPQQTITAAPGTVQPSMTIHLDDLIKEPSCGTHQYNGMSAPREFFLESGTWTLTARAENCCSGVTNATFTIAIH